MKHKAASGMVSEHLQRATFGSGAVWPLNIEYTVVSMSDFNGPQREGRVPTGGSSKQKPSSGEARSVDQKLRDIWKD